MSKLYAGFLVIASMLALSGLGLLGLVLITHLIDLGAKLTSASLLNVVGLLASLIGVILLFRYGMPFRVPTGGYSLYITETPDPKVLAAERVYWWLVCSGWV